MGFHVEPLLTEITILALIFMVVSVRIDLTSCEKYVILYILFECESKPFLILKAKQCV